MKTSSPSASLAGQPGHRLLIVGPLPPPIGGAPLTVQAILDELANHPSITAVTINSSPSLDPRKKMTGFNLEKVRRIFAIIPHFIREVPRCDAVLVMANDLFAITMVPILLLLARVNRKPFYIKPVGGDLDVYIETHTHLFRRILLGILRGADGVLVQTRLLQTALEKIGCTNTFYIPGFRPVVTLNEKKNGNPQGLRLIFLAHITREKGSLVLLQALQHLAQNGNPQVSCDFYGPVHDDIREEFFGLLNGTPNARYCGVAEAGIGTQLIATYDTLVLPTYFTCEGHPGVIIEAMHAGVPVISTLHRAIPELISQGENGIMVPVNDSPALAEAIQRIAQDPLWREQMGRANLHKGQEFSAEVVVAQMLKIIFPP